MKMHVTPVAMFKPMLLIFLFTSVLAADGQTSPTDSTSDASIRKGKVLIGTYFDFSLSAVTKTRVNRLDTKSDVLQAGINITGGKMLSDRWGILISVGFNQASTSTPLTIGGNSIVFDEKKQDYTLAPSIRYYKLIGDATYFFLQGTFLFSRGTSEVDEFDGTNVVQLNFKTQGYGVGISPGLSFFMTDKLSTEIAIGLLGYGVISGEDDKGNKTEAKIFQSLLYLNSVSLGFVYYL